MKRLVLVPLALLLVSPTGCASSRASSGGAWMAGMMGVMVVGGLILGRGVMHGGRGGMHEAQPAAFVERFSPAALLAQRDALELTDEQVSALEALRDDLADGRRTAERAARAAYDLLRPVQRAAVPAGAARPPGHH